MRLDEASRNKEFIRGNEMTWRIPPFPGLLRHLRTFLFFVCVGPEGKRVPAGCTGLVA